MNKRQRKKRYKQEHEATYLAGISLDDQWCSVSGGVLTILKAGKYEISFRGLGCFGSTSVLALDDLYGVKGD